MKKVLLFLVLATFTLSCSSSDSKDDAPAQSPIIGTWKPVSKVTIGHYGTESTLDACAAAHEKITFHANGLATGILAYGDDINDCYTQEAGNTSWSISGGKLTLSGTDNDSVTSTISFSNNNKMFTLESKEGPVSDPFIHTSTYTKVE